MDEKKVIDFCRELNIITNKYKIVIESKNNQLLLNELIGTSVYTPEKLDSSSENINVVLNKNIFWKE